MNGTSEGKVGILQYVSMICFSARTLIDSHKNKVSLSLSSSILYNIELPFPQVRDGAAQAAAQCATRLGISTRGMLEVWLIALKIMLIHTP